MMTTAAVTNPFVGPRTFERADADRFFGRDSEARDLLALVISQRLVLFYAQSGAGKSSLLNTRLAPQLEKKGLYVLPVGRVGGELPASVGDVDNIFVFNLMLSLDKGKAGRGGDPVRLAHLTLGEFLHGLTSDDDGQSWYYDPMASADDSDDVDYAAANTVLMIDQFEEIITTHPARWPERSVFFTQLDAAMQADPRLRVVLTLREDYVAALDPYSYLLADKLRARFYMERMGVDAALLAIRTPAEQGGRPFAPGVAEKLADDLSQVRVPGQETTVRGQYVEPVQLQVVCYQLWENLKEHPAGQITAESLRKEGNVDRALEAFYELTLKEVLDTEAARNKGVNERNLREWFDNELITQAQTRALLYKGRHNTGKLPNEMVERIQSRFLIHEEVRSGDVWIELIHDRLIPPIQTSNRNWRQGRASASREEMRHTPLQQLPSGLGFAHSLAILIGIDQYGNGIPQLSTAVNDSRYLAKLLYDQMGYDVIHLTEPTKLDLIELFSKELPALVTSEDRVLVYFAGQGLAENGDGIAGFLFPADATVGARESYLAMEELNRWLEALPCLHLFLILDCCFPHAAQWSGTARLQAIPSIIHKELMDRYLRSPAWQALASFASSSTAAALDAYVGQPTRGTANLGPEAHSPFALALFEALSGAADLIPNGRGDGVITATELYVYLRDAVEVQLETYAKYQQTPGLWPLNKHRQGEFIFLVPGRPLNLPPAPALTAEVNPYRGLQSYDLQHRQLFFGREDESRELAAMVSQKRFVVVLGASETGKSSLVKAGVLPRLPYVILPPMRPTDRPARALEALLLTELSEELGSLGGLGPARGDALAQIIARWSQTHPGQRLVLTIDQFEELVTLCRDDAERKRFLRLLAETVQQQPDSFRLIITLRTDFEPQFHWEGSSLAEAWQQGRYNAPPMDIEDLRQVIEGPASMRVLYFDPPELVDEIINEIIKIPSALPLLSFTLSELYLKYVQSGRGDRLLSREDYRALGGVVGSLAVRANEEYDNLPDDAHRQTMQRVMLRMVAVEGGELALRGVALSELEYPTTEENARVQMVLDRLVDARLLVRLSAADGISYVKPASSALATVWDRLLRWQRESDHYLPLQRQLWQAASAWNEAPAERKSGLLWDDDPSLPQLEQLLWPAAGKGVGLAAQLRRAHQMLLPNTAIPPETGWLNRRELAFVRASVKRRAAFPRRIVGVTMAVLLTFTILTFFAQMNYQRLRSMSEQTIQAMSTSAEAALALRTAPETSLLLAAEAIQMPEADAVQSTVIWKTLHEVLTATVGSSPSTEAEAIALACHTAGRNLSWEEWQEYFPTERYRQTCMEWPIHPSVPEAWTP